MRASLFRLPRVTEPTAAEVLACIVAERRRGRLGNGVGVTDVVVLYAARDAGAQLLTAGRRLREAWRRWYGGGADPT